MLYQVVAFSYFKEQNREIQNKIYVSECQNINNFGIK